MRTTAEVDLQIVAAMAQKELDAMKADDKQGIGEPTDLKCTCGGTMHRFDPTKGQYERLKKELGNPRYSRRKRQMKKNRKNWRKKAGFRAFLLAAIVRPLRNLMGFVCIECGSRRGFYDMMAKSMFRIEPMPEGAKLVYR